MSVRHPLTFQWDSQTMRTHFPCLVPCVDTGMHQQAFLCNNILSVTIISTLQNITTKDIPNAKILYILFHDCTEACSL